MVSWIFLDDMFPSFEHPFPCVFSCKSSQRQGCSLSVPRSRAFVFALALALAVVGCALVAHSDIVTLAESRWSGPQKQKNAIRQRRYCSSVALAMVATLWATLVIAFVVALVVTFVVTLVEALIIATFQPNSWAKSMR